jgi:sporulation protein YlmC with PRC-barrel domain
VSKITTAVAIAAIVSAGIPAAFAPTRAGPDAPDPPSIQSDQVRASKIIGSTVYDIHNRDIGSVKDLVLDRSGKVAEVVVDVGSFLGFGGKFVAVKISDLNSDNNRLTLDRTKGQLQQMAEYHLSDPKTGAGTTSSPPTGGQLGR